MNTWSTPIEKLMHWHTKSGWKKYGNTNNCILKVYYDQLIIVSEEKILESLNFHCKLKGLLKNNVFILIIKDAEDGIRKIRFQFMNDALQCVEKLSAHLSITNYSNSPAKNLIQSDIKFNDIEKVLQDAVNKRDDNPEQSAPESFANFVKMCLMDPTFPKFISETEKVLEAYKI